MNANVNNGCKNHITQSIIIQIQIRVVVLRQNPIIIRAKTITSIRAVTLAIDAKAKNNADINKYFIL
jgi:hypothetical protein